jgi:hypothetical protein
MSQISIKRRWRFCSGTPEHRPDDVPAGQGRQVFAVIVAL